MGQEERHRFGEAVGAHVEHRDQVANARSRQHRPGGEDVEPRTQRTRHRRIDGCPAGVRGENGQSLLALDQGRPQKVVDASVEDRHRRRVGALHVHDPGHVRASGTHQEPAWLEHELQLAVSVRVPALTQLGQAPAQPGQVERPLAVGVGDAEPASRVDQAQRSVRLGGHPPADLHELRHVAGDLLRVAQVRGAEGVQAQQLNVLRTGSRARRLDERLERHAELPLGTADDSNGF